MKKKQETVFLVSLLISLIVICYGAIWPDQIAVISNVSLAFLNKYFSWFYLLSLPCILLFLLWLACGKYGDIKLGQPEDEPEHSFTSWFAMLFCAGTGIGLVFWSIAEPLTHFSAPPYGIEPGSEAAADFAIRTSFLHWGFLPWACFGLVGLGLAYFQFAKKKNGLMSSLFIPLFGEKLIDGAVGKVIDIFSVIVSVAGVATSLGLGCMQICGGTEYLFGIPSNRVTWLIVIIVITCIFLASSISGVNKGIKLLSNINSWLAIALLVLGFFIGPTNTILNVLVNGLGDHIANFIKDSMMINPWGDNSWVLNWRVFYWAWWIAWAPFVGMFIARISKGRTVREFVIAVVAVPSLLTFLWYSVFGTIAITADGGWTLSELAEIAGSPETAVFKIFNTYPLGSVMSVLVVVLLAIFFITSADSATFSLSMLSSQGDLNPPNYKKVVWGVVEAAMAYILLISGGLKPLQTISIVAALPFLFIMILLCFSLVKVFREK